MIPISCPTHRRPRSLAAPFRAALLLLLVAAGVAAGAAAGIAGPAAAGGDGWASPWIEKEQLALRLVSDSTRLGPDGAARLGLQVRLQPGWTFYWRHPGDNGLAPLLDWSGSENLGEVAVDWPAPHRKEVLGAQNYVYTEEVVLPVRLTAGDAGAPLLADLHLDYGVCKEVCVPYSDNLALMLQPGTGDPTPGAALLDWYAGLVPEQAGSQEVRLAARLPPAGAAGEGRLAVVAEAAKPFTAPDLFLEGPEGMWFGVPEVTLSDDRRHAVMRLRAGPAEALQALAGRDLRITLVDTDRAVEDRVIVTAAGDNGHRQGGGD